MGGLLDFLSRAEPAHRPHDLADAIFVFAGSQARKEFAVEVWPSVGTPALVVSVGRFEWRRYAALRLPGDAELRAVVERVPPRERHFFVVVERGNASAIAVPRRRFGTRNEARALAALVRERGWRSVEVISSGFHMRRVALVVRRALEGTGAAPSYLAMPPERDPYGPGRWWRTPRGVRLILSEVGKLFVYAAFLRR